MPSTDQLIDADIDTVWSWMTVPERMSLWISSVENMRTEDGGTLRIRSTLLFNSRGREHSSIVTAYDAARALTLHSKQGSFSADYQYSLASHRDKTVVTLDVRCGATGPARLIAPFVRLAMWLTDGGQLKKLKALVEAGNSNELESQ